MPGGSVNRLRGMHGLAADGFKELGEGLLPRLHRIMTKKIAEDWFEQLADDPEWLAKFGHVENGAMEPPEITDPAFELALLCDMRYVDARAEFGVYGYKL